MFPGYARVGVAMVGAAALAAGCTSLLGIDDAYRLEGDSGAGADGTTGDVGGAGHEGGGESSSSGGPSDSAGEAPGDGGGGGGSDAFPAQPGPVASVTAGRFHTCIRFVSGVAMCWGRNEDYGELGNGTMASTSVAEPAMGSGIVKLVAGAHDTCALLDGGAACAGKGGLGELGDGVGDADVPTPVPVTVFPSAPVAIASGDAFTCAVVGGGDVWCVGDGAYGALGNGSTASSVTAVPVSLQGKKASAIAAFNLHACALATDGTVWCWGDDSSGQLGNGAITPDAGSATPAQVQGLPGAASAVCVGDEFSCAIVGNDSSSTVWCWGDNSGGELGNGDPSVTQSATPVKVAGMTGAATLTCGSGHACIGNDYGQAGIWCWGRGGSGQLGTGDTNDSFRPQQVGSYAFPQSLAAGGFHTCALTSSPNVLCWGANDFGQLGNDSPDASDVPGLVVGIP